MGNPMRSQAATPTAVPIRKDCPGVSASSAERAHATTPTEHAPGRAIRLAVRPTA